MARAQICPVCGGEGKYKGKPCHGCGGKGWILVPGGRLPYPFTPHDPPYHPRPLRPWDYPEFIWVTWHSMLH